MSESESDSESESESDSDSESDSESESEILEKVVKHTRIVCQNVEDVLLNTL